MTPYSVMIWTICLLRKWDPWAEICIRHLSAPTQRGFTTIYSAVNNIYSSNVSTHLTQNLYLDSKIKKSKSWDSILVSEIELSQNRWNVWASWCPQFHFRYSGPMSLRDAARSLASQVWDSGPGLRLHEYEVSTQSVECMKSFLWV